MKKYLIAVSLFFGGAVAGSALMASTLIKESAWIEDAAAAVVVECKQDSVVKATYTVPAGKTWTGQVKIVGREKDAE